VLECGDPKHVLENYTALSHDSSLSDSTRKSNRVAGEDALQPIPPTAPRHGDGRQKITGFSVRSGATRRGEFAPGDRLQIDVGVEAVEGGLVPNVGIQIQDRFGHKACGTNTFMHSCAIPPIGRGEHIRATFDIQLMLGEGEYTVSIGLASNEPESSTVYDWIDRVAGLRVIQPPDMPVNGFAYCPVGVSYSTP